MEGIYRIRGQSRKRMNSSRGDRVDGGSGGEGRSRTRVGGEQQRRAACSGCAAQSRSETNEEWS